MFKNLSACFVITVLFFSTLYASQSTTLQVIEKEITVDGKKSKVFAVEQPDGTFGYNGRENTPFDVTVVNKTKVPLVLHWHGIDSPNPQDGVPYVTQLPILPGKEYHYHFKLKQEGTYWLHSHYKLQEQKLMAAPLIIYPEQPTKENDVLMFVQDFSFTDPRILYERLRKVSEKKMDMSKMKMTGDVNDVAFDAFLTNHRTLKDPSVSRVKPGELVRLRIINASSSSNYYIDLGKLKGSLFAVDSVPVKPIQGSRFQIAIGNRLDIHVTIPKGEGAYPILALPEGTKQQTGLILATENAKIPTLSENTLTMNPILNYQQELKLKPLQAMPKKKNDRSLLFTLNGSMQGYRWTINNQEWPYITPYEIKAGERIEMIFQNDSGMAHPMHFHGHIFQITEINNQKLDGRYGDSILVMPHSTVKTIWDSNNPGIWMLHCHVLYHQAGGMMTTINYKDYPNRFTTEERVKGEALYGKSM